MLKYILYLFFMIPISLIAEYEVIVLDDPIEQKEIDTETIKRASPGFFLLPSYTGQY